MNSSALSPTLMWPCPERGGVTTGCLYLEIEGQSCLVGSVDQGLMKKRQIDLLGRLTPRRASKKKKKVIFPHSDVTRNLSANNPQKKFANFLAKLYRLSIVIRLRYVELIAYNIVSFSFPRKKLLIVSALLLPWPDLRIIVMNASGTRRADRSRTGPTDPPVPFSRGVYFVFSLDLGGRVRVRQPPPAFVPMLSRRLSWCGIVYR